MVNLKRNKIDEFREKKGNVRNILKLSLIFVPISIFLSLMFLYFSKDNISLMYIALIIMVVEVTLLNISIALAHTYINTHPNKEELA